MGNQRFSKFHTLRFTFSFCCAVTMMVFTISTFTCDFAGFTTTGKISAVLFHAFIWLAIFGGILTSFGRWNYLEVHQEGFDIKYGRASNHYKWSECGRFFGIEQPTMLGIRKRHCLATNLENPGKVYKISKALTGAHVLIPFKYGIRPEDLIDIMNEYRDRWISINGGGGWPQHPQSARGNAGNRPVRFGRSLPPDLAT